MPGKDPQPDSRSAVLTSPVHPGFWHRFTRIVSPAQGCRVDHTRNQDSPQIGQWIPGRGDLRSQIAHFRSLCVRPPSATRTTKWGR